MQSRHRSIGAEGARANSDEMLHRDRAPEAELRRAAPGRPAGCGIAISVAVVEIVAQEGGGAGVVLGREQDLGAVEFHAS